MTSNKKIQDEFSCLSKSDLAQYTIVYFEHIKGTDSIHYRLDIPHKNYDEFLCDEEKSILILQFSKFDTSNINSIKSTLQTDDELIDLIIFFVDSPIDNNKIIGRIIGLGKVANFRYNNTNHQKLLAMGQLAMGMAHDINNQLMVLYGAISQIEEKGHISKQLETIKHVADNSTYMLKQITDFSRLDRDREIINVNDMVSESIEIFSHNMRKNIILKKKLKAKKDVILGKITMLQSVILNIAINARDAMAKGGEICFSTYNIIDNQGKKRIAIKIEDNGEGIDKEVLPCIFEMFYTTKATGKGTGLGLALAKTTVEEHGGTIEVESEKGKGTAFIIKLLLASQEESQPIPVLSYAVISKNATQRLLLSNFVRKELKGFCMTFATVKMACNYYKENNKEINIMLVYSDENDAGISENTKKVSECIFKQMLKTKPFLKWMYIDNKSNLDYSHHLIKTKAMIKEFVYNIFEN
jgi:signal transduction histidine kinase